MSFLAKLFGKTPVPTLSSTDFVAQRDPEAPLLDVRTPREFAAGHLKGAVNVDVLAPDFRQRIEALDLPEEGPVYLYCRSGNRSGQAAQQLIEMGHAGAVNVGGFNALSAAGAKTA